MTLDEIMLTLDASYDAFMILDAFFLGYCLLASGVYNEDY